MERLAANLALSSLAANLGLQQLDLQGVLQTAACRRYLRIAVHPFLGPFIHSFIHSVAHLSKQAFSICFLPSIIQSLTHLFIRSFVY